jgi:Fic family protein
MAQTFIWSKADWPRFQFDAAQLGPALSIARREQGKVMGLFHAIGFHEETDVAREIWTEEAVATAEIEGEKLDLAAVRSSVTRRLGAESDGEMRVSGDIDGLLDVMQDAIGSFREMLDDDRLHRWQSALFPGGTTGIRRIAVGKYRTGDHSMQIVSGPVGREKVHYEAPPSTLVPGEMRRFIEWWERTRPDREQPQSIDGLVRAAIAHLWFETIHPFDDGNGRIGRAIIDMALAQDVQTDRRLYSIARQLMAERKAYYDNINAAQHGTLDVTTWVTFFVAQFTAACATSQQVVEAAIEKSKFWAAHARHALNDRQLKTLKRLLDAGKGSFEGGLSAEKYANLTGASKATATRDLTDLVKAGLLVSTGRGRGTRYWVNLPGWSTANGSPKPTTEAN